MYELTLKQRIAIESRIADLTERMVQLDHLRVPANIPAWNALNQERDGLEKQLADDL